MKGIQGLFGRFLSIFSGQLLTTLIAIVSTPIIVRLLGPSQYGDYSVFLSIFALYMIPISSGITEGVQKFVADSRDSKDWQELVIWFYTVLATATVLIGVIVLVIITALGIPAWSFGEEFTLYFYLLAIFIFVAQFRALTYHTVLGFGLEPISESLKVLRKFGTVSLGIGMLLLGYGVAGMIFGHIVINIVVATLAGVVILRRISIPNLFRVRIRSAPIGEFLSFNGLNIVLVLLLMSLYHIDIVMLRAIVGSEVTGFYKAALQLAEYIWIVPIALQLLLLHSTATLWSEGRTDEITNLATKLTRYTVLLVIIMAIGVAVLADRFIPLYYGSEFTDAIIPLLLLLPGAVGFAIARPLQAISQGSGKMKTLIIATGAGAGINLVLNAILIPFYGMYGAAIATSVSYGSMFFFYVWAARKIGYYPLSDFRGTRIAVVALVVTPILWFTNTLITYDILAFILIPPFGLGLYLLIAIAVGALDQQELRNIVGRVSTPLFSTRSSGK